MLLAITFGLTVMPGCGSPKKESNLKEKASKLKPLLPDELSINTKEGSATVRSLDEPHDPKKPRDLLYTISWKEARLTAAEEGILSGSMSRVTGELFDRNEKPKPGEKPETPILGASTFAADDAVAQRKTMTLTLIGHVRLKSKLKADDGKPDTQPTMIQCDKVEWLKEERIVKASGNVRVEGKFGTMSGLNEVWATGDLSLVATPSMFKKP